LAEIVTEQFFQTIFGLFCILNGVVVGQRPRAAQIAVRISISDI